MGFFHRARVQTAYDIQQKRFVNNGSPAIICNAGMYVGEIRQFCKLQAEGQSLMRAVTKQMNWSARPFHRTLKSGRAIANLAGGRTIQSPRLVETPSKPSISHIPRAVTNCAFPPLKKRSLWPWALYIDKKNVLWETVTSYGNSYRKTIGIRLSVNEKKCNY